MWFPTEAIVVPSDWRLKSDASKMITIVEKKVSNKVDLFITTDDDVFLRAEVLELYEPCVREDRAQRIWAHKCGFKYMEG